MARNGDAHATCYRGTEKRPGERERELESGGSEWRRRSMIISLYDRFWVMLDAREKAEQQSPVVYRSQSRGWGVRRLLLSGKGSVNATVRSFGSRSTSEATKA